MRRSEPYFLLSHEVPRVDDRWIIFVIRNGLRWRDAPREYGPYKMIYNRFVRWSRMGVFNKIFAAVVAKGPKPDQLMIDATHLKAHRTAASLLKKGSSRCIGRIKGGLDSKLHAICDSQGRPLITLLSEGQRSDFEGAALMLNGLLKAKALLGDKGYDADWFRAAPANRSSIACNLSKANRRVQIPHDRILYLQRHRSKTCSANSRTGAASTPATTAAPIP